jgi:hypothetical protein
MSRRRIRLHRSTTTLAVLALLMTAGVTASGAVSAGDRPTSRAAVTAPPAGESWPMCTARAQFCVERLLMDGVDMTGSTEWRIDAALLDSGNGTYGANWYLLHSSDGGINFYEPPPAGTAAWLVVDLNLGNVRPRFTEGYGQQASLSFGGDATAGWTLHAEGFPATMNWKWDSTDGHNCSIGDCGGVTTRADSRNTMFGGNTQDLSGWSASDRAWATGMWIMTDAQYYAEPLLLTEPPAPYWQIQLANVHLDLDGVPVVGSYSAKVSADGLAAAGLTASEAASLGLDVRRVVDGVSYRVPASVMATGDGGIYLRVPQVAYSSPRLKVFARQAGAGYDANLPPDPPRWKSPALSALTGGAAAHVGRPYFDGGAALSTYTARCTAPGQVTRTATSATSARLEVVGLANGVTYSCQVRASNSAGKTGRWSYARTVAPSAGAPAPAPRVAAPLRTTDTSATKRVRVSWSAPPGASYPTGTLFAVTKAVNGSSNWSTVSTGTTGTSRVFSVSPGSTYRFRVTATPPASTVSAATVATTVAPVDDAATKMRYSQGWHGLAKPGRYLGTVHRSHLAKSTLTVTGTGTQIWVVGDRGPTLGQFRVRIDGGAWSRYADTRAATGKVRRLLWSSRVLRDKQHTVQIQVRGTSGRPTVSIDGVAFLR